MHVTILVCHISFWQLNNPCMCLSRCHIYLYRSKHSFVIFTCVNQNIHSWASCGATIIKMITAYSLTIMMESTYHNKLKAKKKKIMEIVGFYIYINPNKILYLPSSEECSSSSESEYSSVWLSSGTFITSNPSLTRKIPTPYFKSNPSLF